MICPVCEAEVYDLETESCSECQTALASWQVCDRNFHARPLLQCCRCGECPSPGDRACRQCQARFLKRVPAWLDAEFPGWFDTDEQAPVSSLRCVSCDMEVLPGRTKCGICDFSFHRPTKISAIKHLERALACQNDDSHWFMSENPFPADAHAAVPDLSTEAFERVLDTQHEEAHPPPAVVPPKRTPAAVPAKQVTIPSPAPVQPTVRSVHDTARRAHRNERIAAAAAVIAARIIPPKARLLAERQAHYKALLASGSIRTVPGVKWLSGQSVVCANGHRSHFGLFAHRPGYGTLDSLPDFKPAHWQDRLATALHVGGEAANDDINDRDPDRDVRWSLGCPMCGTDGYTFEAAPLRDYAMCTASADYWWVFCHLYRRGAGTCGNCEIRRDYWDALRLMG